MHYEAFFVLMVKTFKFFHKYLTSDSIYNIKKKKRRYFLEIVFHFTHLWPNITYILVYGISVEIKREIRNENKANNIKRIKTLVTKPMSLIMNPLLDVFSY